MLRTVSPEQSDKLTQLSESAWAVIVERGEFFEASAGDLILEAEQTDNNLLIILSGKATLLYPSEDGFTPTAIYRDRGKVLHHAGMHLKAPNPFQIAALEDATRVVLLERKTVYELIGQDVGFAEYLFRDLSVRFLSALEFLRQEREEPLILRLAKRLLSIAENESDVELTQAEIAEIMAVTRISVSKTLKSLEGLGLVKRSQRALITVNTEALEQWVAEQEA